MASRSAMYRNQDYKTSMNSSNSNLDQYPSQQQLNSQGDGPYAQRSSAQSNSYAQRSSAQSGGPYAQQGSAQSDGPYAQRSSAQSGGPYAQQGSAQSGGPYAQEVPYAMESRNTNIDPRWKNNQINVEKRVPNDIYPSVIRDQQQKQQMILQQQRKQKEMKRRYYENYKNHIVQNDNSKMPQAKMPQAFYKRSASSNKATTNKYNPNMNEIVDSIFSSASEYLQALDDKDNELNPVAEAVTSRKLDCNDKTIYIIIIIILCIVIFLLVYKLYKNSRKSD